MKAILKQKIGAIKQFIIPGDGYGITQQEILEIDEEMTIRELMEKMIGTDHYLKPDEPLKDSAGETISNSDCQARDTNDSIVLKYKRPVRKEWYVK